MIKASDLCGYARAAIGGGYCYGSDGEICTPERREQWAEANPSQRDHIMGTSAKWDGMYVWDCSGLFRGAWRALDAYKSGGATTIFQTWCSETGELDSMPDEPGIAVFRGEGDEMEHIGLYTGDGMVVDARGSDKGVLYQPRDDNTWTHWGRLLDVDYSKKGQTGAALYQATVKTEHGGGIGIWSEPSTASTELTQVYDGGFVDVYIEREDGWRQVGAAPIRGYANGEYLIPQNKPFPRFQS